MKTTDLNKTFIETYFGLIKNLSPDIKQDIIEKLSQTLKSDLTKKKPSMKDSYGAWQSEKSADEIIMELRKKS